jgi:N-methylhydantoinase A
VIDDLKQASEALKLPLTKLMEECSSTAGGSFIHGSTISTNAMVEKKVAKTGLICTKGFRDILTIREGIRRPNPYHWDLDFPQPYIPRYLTLPVSERINAEGGVEIPLNEEEVRQVIRQFKEWNVEAIAVSLLWSITNPIHELKIGRIIEKEWPPIPYVLGHQVNPCIREYRRTSSAVIDASLKPIISKYISSFINRLKETGYKGEMLMLTSSGGVMSTDELMQKPIYSVDSGPSLAPNAGLWFAAREFGKLDCVTVDMGGTSFDVACITDGEIKVSRESFIEEHILSIPKVDTRSIGAGGGSIAWVDSGGLIHVGPQSAGSVPGPASYGRGGKEATVTDANVVLGYIDPEYFLGGKMPLNRKWAELAIQEKVAKPLKLTLEEAAFTIWSTVNS